MKEAATMSDESTEMTHIGPGSPSNAYGQPISAERQAELRVLIERQRKWVAQAEAERGKSAFQDVQLSGADVWWLREHMLALHLEGADLNLQDLKWASFLQAHLEGVNLWGAHLEEADLEGAHLQEANLITAHLQRANLGGA